MTSVISQNIILLYILITYFVVAASALLNWSYQNTKPCEVLVGGNTQIVQTSKSIPSDTTNLSTSTRPKTPNNGGKFSDLILSRKRRQVDGISHVINVTTDINDLKFSPSTSSVDIVHATVINVPHESPSTSHTDEEETTSQINLQSTSEGAGNSTLQKIFNEDNEETKSTEIFTNAITSEEDINISDSSIFTLDSDIYDELLNEFHNFESTEIQHDDPMIPLTKADDIQFFDMGSQHLTSDQKSRALYNIDEDKHPNPNLTIVSLIEHKGEEKKSTFLPNNSSAKVPNHKTEQIEIPTITNTSSTHPTNNVVVNITIATGFGTSMLSSSPPVYMLSLLIPTDGTNEPNVVVLNKESNNTKEVPEMPSFAETGNYDSTNDNSGGTCECSCPCLESYSESSESNFNEDYDLLNYLNPSLENVNNKSTTSTERALNVSSSTIEPEITEVYTVSSTLTSDMTEPVVTVRNCPEIKPPPILILEGRKL